MSVEHICEPTPNYYSTLDTTSEGEAGGDKPEQAELWGRMEERWLWQEFLGDFRLLSQTLVQIVF